MSDEIEVAAGARKVPTVDEISPVVEKILREGDPKVLTIGKVMEALSKHFEVPLKVLSGWYGRWTNLLIHQTLDAGKRARKQME